MIGRYLRNRRAFCMFVVWAVVLPVVGACFPPATVIAPPQVPNGMSGVVLDVLPEDLALTRADMPAGFQLAAEKSSGPEYFGLYLRPSALDPEASGGNSLLSVLTSVGVYPTTAAAENVYLEASGDPTKQADEEIAQVSAAATDIITEPFEGAVQGGDATEAFHVSYSLMDRRVFEYGHRFRLGNVLVHVVVAALGTPDEPEHLLEDARDLVQRQVDHIVEAAGQAAPE